MIVEETVEYDVFKTHMCNRELNPTNLKKIEKSIKEKNLLANQPILVDTDFNVIDGNHRLHVARKLGIPVFYQVIQNCQDRDMILLNNNKKFWGISDYLKYYSMQGLESYIKLGKFIEERNIKTDLAIQLLNGTRSTGFFVHFKEGAYQFPSDLEYKDALDKHTKIMEVIEYVKKKTSGSKTYLDRVTFYGALVDFFNIKSIVYDVFKKKLEMRIDFLRHCTRQCDYVKIFRDIYNWKNQSPINEYEQSGF